jgi:hypothetical protein
MNKETIELAKNRKLVTYRIMEWIGPCTKTEICEMIGITRPTLEVRIKKHSWRLKEIELIIKKLPS